MKESVCEEGDTTDRAVVSRSHQNVRCRALHLGSSFPSLRYTGTAGSSIAESTAIVVRSDGGGRRRSKARDRV